MQKIPTLFQRNMETDRLVRPEVTPGCEWVLQGEGIATRKLDGTCCLIKDGKLYRRHELRYKRGPDNCWHIINMPSEFIAATERVDEMTGKQQGWMPVGNGPEDRWHREAWDRLLNRVEGETLELIGPKVQGNPEKEDKHILLYHYLTDPFHDCPRDFVLLKEWLKDKDVEGIVWWHPDGRKAKIKKRDFGLKRN